MNNNKVYKLSPQANVIYIVIAISSIIYTLQNRSFYDFVKFSSFIFTSIFTLIFIVLCIYVIKYKTFGIFKGNRNLYLTFLFLIVLLGPIYYSIGVVIRDLFSFIKTSQLSGKWLISTTVFGILLFGLLLFYFRLYFRCVYGLTETVIGVFIAVDKVTNQNFTESTDSTFYLAILTASLYLIVRGFDNIHQGFTKEPLDPVAQKFHRLFRPVGS
jgi:hypothetical protein